MNEKFTLMQDMEHTKFINAQPAISVYKYNSTKQKLKTNAVIWFNKMCKANHLTPRYIYHSESNFIPFLQCTRSSTISSYTTSTVLQTFILCTLKIVTGVTETCRC